MARQSVVDKINESSEFLLSNEEIRYIVENWISSHTKHKSEVSLTNSWDQEDGCSLKAEVKLDRSYLYKYF